MCKVCVFTLHFIISAKLKQQRWWQQQQWRCLAKVYTHTHSAGLMITVCSDKSTSSVARLWNRHKFIYKYWKNAYRTNDVHKAGFHPSCRLAPQIQHPYTERKREREISMVPNSNFNFKIKCLTYSPFHKHLVCLAIAWWFGTTISKLALWKCVFCNRKSHSRYNTSTLYALSLSISRLISFNLSLCWITKNLN